MCREFALAGCVILYHPNQNVVKNILSYVDHVDMLYIIDNSEGQSVFERLAETHRNVTLIQYPTNMGIAKPLNDVLKKCEGQFSHLLTLDQDGYFDGDNLIRYIDLAKELEWKNVLGIAPIPISENSTRHGNGTTKLWKEMLRVVTSGNIVNIENALRIGGYDEKLFIDEVDHDFCYRGWAAGLKTLRSNDVVYIRHTQGEPIEIRHFGRAKRVMGHNYIRTYYIIRNSLYVTVKDWKVVKRVFIKKYLIDTIKFVSNKLFFETDKKQNLRIIIEACKDAVNGNMGKKDFSKFNA